jgi:hypothetical protein
LGPTQAEILKRTMQGIDDLRKYQSKLASSIARANLNTVIIVKGLGEMTLHDALELRGRSKKEGGTLEGKERLLMVLKSKIQRVALEVEATSKQLPKDSTNVTAVNHVDPKAIENELARITQFRHDLDVAIEATNFTAPVDLAPLPDDDSI